MYVLVVFPMLGFLGTCFFNIKGVEQLDDFWKALSGHGELFHQVTDVFVGFLVPGHFEATMWKSNVQVFGDVETNQLGGIAVLFLLMHPVFQVFTVYQAYPIRKSSMEPENHLLGKGGSSSKPSFVSSMV